MTSLLTLPQFQSQAWKGTKSSAFNAVTRDERATWGAWLKGAVMRHWVSADEAMNVMASGRSAFHALFARFAPCLPDVPRLSAAAIKPGPITSVCAVNPELLRDAVSLIEAMAHDDPQTRSEISAYAPGDDCAGFLRNVAARAWIRRVQRVTGSLAKGFEDFSETISVVPLAIVRLDLEIRQQEDYRQFEVELPTASLMCERHHGDARLDVDPIREPAFFAAVTKAWNRIAKAGRLYAVEPFSIASLRDSPMAEQLFDAALAAQCKNGAWTLPQAAIEELSYVGIDFDGEQPPPYLADFFRWAHAFQALEKKPATGGFDASQQELLDQLTEIEHSLRKVKISPHSITLPEEANWVGDFRLLPMIDGESWLAEQMNEHRFGYGDLDTSWAVFPKERQNMRELLRLADAAILSYTLATKAAYLIDQYDPRSSKS